MSEVSFLSEISGLSFDFPSCIFLSLPLIVCHVIFFADGSLFRLFKESSPTFFSEEVFFFRVALVEKLGQLGDDS